MPVSTEQIARIAQRHGLSESAVAALSQGLGRGGGGAQWNHPDLGGMGQWLGGGMLQIGDMFNHGLKARVGAALAELAELQSLPGQTAEGRGGLASPVTWWPGDLGRPSATGSQNGMRYAFFPERRRLVIDRDGRVTTYDTGSHRLTGFAQSQGGTHMLRFTGPDGEVPIDGLTAMVNE